MRLKKNLIGPALDRAWRDWTHHEGDSSAREIFVLDMFQLLLTADLVVADISIHNANVFYELGMRHALRESTRL